MRASACLAAAGLAVVVIVWTEKSLWRRADELRARAASVNSERFRLSEPLEVKLRSLNDLVFRYSLDAQAPAAPHKRRPDVRAGTERADGLAVAQGSRFAEMTLLRMKKTFKLVAMFAGLGTLVPRRERAGCLNASSRRHRRGWRGCG